MDDLTPDYLLTDLYMVIPLHLLQQSVLTAGVEHPLLDATAVPRHGVDEY